MKIIRLRNNKGFTLIEILIAITVFSIGLLGMATLTTGIIRGNLASNNLTTATVLAQEQMEDIIRDGYAKASGKDENYGSITDFSQYKRVTVVDDNKPETDMKIVTVTVSWDSDSHSVILKTILTK
ncbi:MAG: prepilin-type N-terminal cleavage/methylation domain-containing protein [Desulfobacteraceae bacterium]|nr:prepilin-type N-terminal cleavage/methylation domain-containing protein [Desulfobacteraceae bacterium]